MEGPNPGQVGICQEKMLASLKTPEVTFKR